METRVAVKKERIHGLLTYDSCIGFDMTIAELIADDIYGQSEEFDSDDVLEYIDALHLDLQSVV